MEVLSPSIFRGYFLPQISQIYTDYLSPTHIYFFEHELHESHEYFVASFATMGDRGESVRSVRSVWKYIINLIFAHGLTRIDTDFFEHETRRRPTDQREVITRISRIYTPTVVAKLTTKSVESHVQEISLISLIRIQKQKSVLICEIRGRLINLWETKKFV